MGGAQRQLFPQKTSVLACRKLGEYGTLEVGS
jgi:hypothetical protein